MRAQYLSAATVEEWPLGVESAWPAGEWLSAPPGQGRTQAGADERQAGDTVRPVAAQPAANDA